MPSDVREKWGLKKGEEQDLELTNLPLAEGPLGQVSEHRAAKKDLLPSEKTAQVPENQLLCEGAVAPRNMRALRQTVARALARCAHC